MERKKEFKIYKVRTIDGIQYHRAYHPKWCFIFVNKLAPSLPDDDPYEIVQGLN